MVWGNTLYLIKVDVYINYSAVFASIIYPLGAHWVFGGGFLQNGHWLGTSIAGMQDFAGSTAVHLIGATGAFAALLLLGPRKGKYGPDGKPRAIPGHSIPLFGPCGTISCGIFTAPRLAQYNAFGDPQGGLVYSGHFTQLAAQAIGLTVAFLFVFSMSFATFYVIKKTYGLRVSEAEEDAGLDISEHGMYGYPEQFIPAPELIGVGPAGSGAAGSPGVGPTPKEGPP